MTTIIAGIICFILSIGAFVISAFSFKEKDTIFFFPGLTADHTMFETQFDYFKEKYNLITWDAPCHGKIS